MASPPARTSAKSMTRSNRGSSSWSWVTASTAGPGRARLFEQQVKDAVLFSGSRLPVASSDRISFGCVTSARQIATRCCSPWLSASGWRSSLSPSPQAAPGPRHGRRASVVQRQGGGDPVGIEDILARRQIIEQREVLKHEPDGAGAKAPHARPRDKVARSVPATVDASLPGRQNARDQVQQRRLAGAAWANDGHAFDHSAA